jgi:uncharacterized protein YkwD
MVRSVDRLPNSPQTTQTTDNGHVELGRRAFLSSLVAGWACRQQTRPEGRSQPPAERPGPPKASDRAGEIEWHILFLTNQQRNWQKLPQFQASAELADVARAHSRDMLTRGFFSHVNPEGLTPKTRAQRAGLKFRAIAENIYSTENGGQDAAEAASHIVTGWMNHPGHRANILNPSLKFLGVGVAVSDTEILATQLFAG